MDALELTMKCSKLLKKPFSTSIMAEESNVNSPVPSNPSILAGDTSFMNMSFSDADFEISRSSVKEG